MCAVPDLACNAIAIQHAIGVHEVDGTALGPRHKVVLLVGEHLCGGFQHATLGLNCDLLRRAHNDCKLVTAGSAAPLAYDTLVGLGIHVLYIPSGQPNQTTVLSYRQQLFNVPATYQKLIVNKSLETSGVVPRLIQPEPLKSGTSSQ